MYTDLDLSNSADLLNIIREYMHYINNIQTMLFALVILVGLVVGIFLAYILLGRVVK